MTANLELHRRCSLAHSPRLPWPVQSTGLCGGWRDLSIHWRQQWAAAIIHWSRGIRQAKPSTKFPKWSHVFWSMTANRCSLPPWYSGQVQWLFHLPPFLNFQVPSWRRNSAESPPHLQTRVVDRIRIWNRLLVLITRARVRWPTVYYVSINHKASCLGDQCGQD